MRSSGPIGDRTSESPVAIDVIEDPHAGPFERRAPRNRSLASIASYLVAGVLLGLVVIVALGVGRGGDDASVGSGRALTDPVTRLHARDLGATCWQGFETAGPARLTVALEVGIDGRVRYATASGETRAMRSCVEAHVMAWAFLPQRAPQSMALPFEVDRR